MVRILISSPLGHGLIQGHLQFPEAILEGIEAGVGARMSVCIDIRDAIRMYRPEL